MKLEIINILNEKKIDCLVVHGLLTSQHTHKFIHEAIYKTFEYLKNNNNKNMEIHWIDDKETNIYDNKESNFLIFSSPHYETDLHLPIIENAYYILHFNKINIKTNKKIDKYDDLLKRKKAIKYIEFRYINNKASKIEDTFFWHEDNAVHLPWATNLLPYEIDKKIVELALLKKVPHEKKNSYFCGSVWRSNEKEIELWKSLCNKHGIEPEFVNEYDESVHQEKIRTSYIAPSIQGKKQKVSDVNFYIPCRIFKNISYGAFPITNNLGVKNLFQDYPIIYNNNLETLLLESIQYMETLHDPRNFKTHKKNMINLMIHIKNEHTYLSRLNVLISKLFQ